VESLKEQYRRERGAAFSFAQMEAVFAGLPQFEACSWHTKGRLYLLLCSARSEYEMRTAYDKIPSAGTVTRELENIRESISRIAAFGRSAVGDNTYRESANSAITLVAAEAHAWAAKQPAHNLPGDFRVTKSKCGGISATDYDEWSVVRKFFERAALIEKFVSAAAKSAARRSHGRPEISPIEWLAGQRLPKIYERIFKKIFGASVTRNGEAGGPGITFIILALGLLGVRPPRGNKFAPNTIRNHVGAARKATD
jgi:hypothetical protein